MKTYSVIKDRNTGSDFLNDGFETLESALEYAKSEIMDTDPSNDSEGINIYSEEGMEITMGKYEDGSGYSYARLNPATQVQVEDSVEVLV